MHRISENTDLSALTGKNVEQICIGVHEVILNLEDDLYITVEGDFSFGGEETVEKEIDFRSAANAFADLLAHTIVDAKVLRNDAVVFSFSNGTNLTVFDSSDHGECFQIKLPDRLIIV